MKSRHLVEMSDLFVPICKNCGKLVDGQVIDAKYYLAVVAAVLPGPTRIPLPQEKLMSTTHPTMSAIHLRMQSRWPSHQLEKHLPFNGLGLILLIATIPWT